MDIDQYLHVIRGVVVQPHGFDCSVYYIKFLLEKEDFDYVQLLPSVETARLPVARPSLTHTLSRSACSAPCGRTESKVEPIKWS